MSEQEQDRSEAATPYKLKEAQHRGQVSKSQEATFAAILAAFVMVLYSVGPSIARQELRLTQQVFDHAARMDWSADTTGAWLFGVLSTALLYLMPLFLAIICAAILANMAQVGAIFSFKPVTPDFDRINPANGLKRIFSITLVYNAGKSLFKLFALTWVLWIVLEHAFPRLFTLGQINVRAHGSLVMGELPPMLFKLLLIILILALLDVGYTRWDYSKKMRMSRREVRDEGKQREGDPRIRARLRQIRAELLKQSRALRSLPDADVLITNPTHIAIALSYKHGEMPAPKMLAKGAGGLAKKMREIARLHNIPVVENRPLARAMYKRVKSGEYLPEDLYPMTAKILLWVYSLRKARARMESSQ
ncbi:EscU/YscU/HrcU family type III secretion system export apparatus switch protein [Solimicrobium silvestre]|uniref:Flagellar biosynthesis pathway component FlhB n=1 Tax=Solimicrobium silvestre TaxID=2099400 RepID=A0A2S9H1S3_9BURK|nr:EscU/YscU/HrcU family type III secretion system export apparatus switch protein [Solimicrobium silvestre]PRC93900.1 Flagellar biosynthesis pathway component FlhB [Solimicrobium silvestre]